MLENLKTSITQNLDYFKDLSPEEIANERKNKFLKIGRNDGFISTTEDFAVIFYSDIVESNNITIEKIY